MLPLLLLSSPRIDTGLEAPLEQALTLKRLRGWEGKEKHCKKKRDSPVIPRGMSLTLLLLKLMMFL